MEDAVASVKARTSLHPAIGVVLGSGLGQFADSVADATRIPYSELPGMPRSTATGHAGELVIGTVADTPVAVMSGRFHLYEGYSARQAVTGIRLLHQFGVRTIVLTNAAGGINASYAEGALVLISDHINLQGTNPLIGPNDDELGPRFPDMTEAYSAELRQRAREAALEAGIELHEGVYVAVQGPSYETPAEIRFLKAIGADLVGMSTVPETIAANHMGMRVLGIACVTNLAAGLSGRKLEHAEVMQIGRRVAGTFSSLLSTLIPRLP